MVMTAYGVGWYDGDDLLMVGANDQQLLAFNTKVEAESFIAQMDEEGVEWITVPLDWSQDSYVVVV